MIKQFAIASSLLFLTAAYNCAAQNKITILGSSTAAGTGASVSDSSWVGRLRLSLNKNFSDGKDTTVSNRAVGGYVTYKSLPTEYPHPADRPDPDPGANVTFVLNDVPRADVVIINYPTNDIVAGYSDKEMMDNLRVMYQQFSQNGIRCYITTTQPRNVSADMRATLRRLVDSVLLDFGSNAINFWDDVATADGQIKPEVNSGDGIHLNDLGHRLLFKRVQDKDVLNTVAGAPLPLVLKEWRVTINNGLVRLNWSTAFETSSTRFEVQRSMDERNFQTLYERAGMGNESNYAWTDLSPLNGRSYYRLKVTEAGKSSFSRIFPLVRDYKQLITSLYADASQLYLQLNCKDQTASLTIIDFSGATVKQQTARVSGSNTIIRVPIAELSFGNYYLRVTTSSGSSAVQKFTRMK